METLANKGIFFREICANAFTRKGNVLCKKWGMEKVADHEDFGVVYSMKLNPWPEHLDFGHLKNLQEAYANAFQRAAPKDDTAVKVPQ